MQNPGRWATFGRISCGVNVNDLDAYIRIVKINSKFLIVALLLAVLLLAGFLLPVQDWLVRGLEWTRGLGVWGPAFVVVFYIGACVFFLPGSVLTIGSGFLFKIFVGVLTASIGSTLGACAAFLVGRTVARNWISRKIAANKKFTAVDDAVESDGFKIVFLIRLSPVFPFNVLNYGFGLTKVSFWKYALASWLGMIPGTFMYVYFGAGLRSLADAAAGEVETGTAGRIFFWFGLAVTIVVTAYVTRVARKAVKKAVERNAVGTVKE